MSRRKSRATVTRTRTSGAGTPRLRVPRQSRLGTLASFSELGADLLREIESCTTERRFEPEEALMRQGDPGDSLMVVQDGEVEVTVSLERERHLLKRAGPGEVFGEMALLTREPRTASVVARTPVTALVLPVAAFDRLAHRNPALAEVLSRLTAERLGRETHDALSGKIFHGYTIRRRLGRGGMAVVYEAEEAATGRQVALKMMSHALVFNERARRRFQREADLVESFDHENIARMFGRFEAFQTYFIVIEFCDGAPLDRILARGRRLEAAAVRRIVGQLAAALAYAHGKRFLHRDLTPSNVMVNRDGVVKLMDFGLARPLVEGGDGEATIAGTPPYMAPEQVKGDPIGVAADLYGLAGLAWEMLAGATLFRATDFRALRREHLAWKVPDVDTALPGVDPELRAFLASCLVRDPTARRAELAAIATWAGRVDPDALLSDSSPRIR